MNIFAASGHVGPTDDFVLAACIRRRSPTFNCIGRTRCSAAPAESEIFLGRDLAIRATFAAACTWPQGLASPDAGTPVNLALFATDAPERPTC
jgi:hypothetical protein